MGLPNFKLYYLASGLVWVKEWIILKNERCLILEGHDLLEGWHSYMWYNINKRNILFKKHMMRDSLIKIWETVKTKIYEKIPTWITPIEAWKQQGLTDWQQIKTYKDFLKADETLKMTQELEDENIKLSWWERIQLETRYNKDKKEKFHMKPTLIDEVFTGPEEKKI